MLNSNGNGFGGGAGDGDKDTLMVLKGNKRAKVKQKTDYYQLKATH